MFLGGKIYAACNKYFALNMNTSIEENLCGKGNVSFSIESEKQVHMFASL
jgi:hypothetical protein